MKRIGWSQRFIALALALVLTVGDSGFSLLSEAIAFSGSEPQIVSNQETSIGGPETGTGDPETGTGDPETGTGGPETGTGDPETSTGDPETGTGDPETGTGDPETGTGDPETGTGDPETGTGGPETGTGDPETGTGDPETGTGDPETGTGDPLPEVEDALWSVSVEGGEDLTWSKENPVDLTFSIHIEPDTTPVTTDMPQTLELNLALPQPFAFVEGASAWEGDSISLNGETAVRLDGVDRTITLSGYQLNGSQLSLTLERSGAELGSLNLTLTIHSTALRTVRPASSLLADGPSKAGGEAQFTIRLTSGNNTVSGQDSVLLSIEESYTITEYREPYEETIFWVDNNNESHLRPSQEAFQKPVLSFQVTPADGKYPSDSTILTEAFLEKLGMESMPEPQISESDAGGWTYTIPQKTLPSKVTYTDIYGDSHSYDIAWSFAPQENDNYVLRAITQEEIDQGTVTSVSSAGWYYIQTRDLTYYISLLSGESLIVQMDTLRDIIRQNFRFTASWLDKNQIFNLEDMADHINVTQSENQLTFSINDVWKYNLDGSLITYKLDQNPGSGEASGKLPLDNTEDYLAILYDNSKVPNFSTIEDALYSGGTLKLTLTGFTNYEAYKVWLDNGSPETIASRPKGVFQLWRYREGKDFSTASVFRKEDGTFVETPVDTTLPPDKKQTITFDLDGDNQPDPLPKYDSEGHKYIYVVREVLDGGNYEQVFGVLQDDDSFQDTVEGGGEREEKNTFLYNSGTLSNRIKNNITVRMTKTWDASAFQSELTDVTVTLGLQSRPKGSSDPWTDSTVSVEPMEGFISEQLTQTRSISVPRYNNKGEELEYRWVETGIYQGDDGNNRLTPNGDGTAAFTLEQLGHTVKYTSTSEVQSDGSTLITNRLDNSLDYQVEKQWLDEKGNLIPAPAGETVTLKVYQGLPGEPLGTEPIATIVLDGTIDQDPTVINPTLGITAQETEAWKGTIHGLPEFDALGRQYEYYLLEEGDGVDRFPIYETERTDEGYSTIVKNPQGGPGNRIMVRKEWVDDSDTAHRLPVTIQAYTKSDNAPIPNAKITLSNGIWYGYIGIGSNKPEDVYILETAVGGNSVPLTSYQLGTGTPNYDKPEAPVEYTTTGAYTAIQFETEWHRYEATYSRDLIADYVFFTVTNRRLGEINFTITKEWKDGDGSLRKQLKEAIAKVNVNAAPEDQIHLAMYLDFDGGEDYYQFQRNGPNQPDSISIGSYDNFTPIKDNNGNAASSVQILDLNADSKEYYFFGLPKYDRNGQVAHYTVREVWVNGNSNEISNQQLKESFSEVYEIAKNFRLSYSDESYIVPDDTHHAADIQTVTITNQLSGTKDVVWHKQWKDAYNYENNLRPDIYLNIYRVVYSPETQSPTVELYQSDYHWTYLEGSESDDGLLSPAHHWHANFVGLPKYSPEGYEYFYYATEHTQVDASKLDYLDTAFSHDVDGDEGNTAVPIGTQTNISNPIPTSNGVPAAVAIPSNFRETNSYALLENGTFTNTTQANVAIRGQKLWKTVPAGYSVRDLPGVTFELYRRLSNQTEENLVATLTIENWNLPYENNAYHFGIDFMGKNQVSVDADGNLVVEPVDSDTEAQPLPKYDANGVRYVYTLKETINLPEGSPNWDKVYKDPVINTYLAENSYDSVKGALAVKKYLQLPVGTDGNPTAYPAVQFVLERRYTRSDRSLSPWTECTTQTWSSQEVQAAYEANSNSNSNDPALLSHEFLFENLDLYAPNGSQWEYRVREVTDGWMDGYTVTSAEGNVDIDLIDTITDLSDTVEGLSLTQNKEDGRGGTADTVAVTATFYDTVSPSQTLITLKGRKVWVDFNDAFGTRPDDLTIEVFRYAPSQPGQGNGIGSSANPLRFTDYQVTWNEWTYTITGTKGELERYAPNGMAWVYQIQETIPSGYTASNGGKAETSGEPDANNVLTVQDLTNSITQSVSYQKQWLGGDNQPITEDYLGKGLTVHFLLQVREGSTGTWENASTFFHWELSSQFDQFFGADEDFTRFLTGRINDTSIWNRVQKFENLPSFLKDENDQTIELSYRVVETQISWKGGSVDVTVQENNDGSWNYTFDSSLFVPGQNSYTLPQNNGTFVISNKLQTTSLTAQKIWDGDEDNAYGTRPNTGRDGYDWEVSLLVQYRIDGAAWMTLTTWETDGEHPVILHIYGTNRDASGSVTLSGLPQFSLDGKAITYRIWELQPHETDVTWWYRTDLTVAQAEESIVETNETFHDAYTASYGNDLLTVTNYFGDILTFRATKTWHGPSANQLVMELQYLQAIENGKEVWQSFDPPATVTLIGKTDQTPNLPYYEDGAWTAVWNNVPKIMPGSYRGERGTDSTRYRIKETVPSGYQTVPEGSPNWQEVTSSASTATFTNVKTTSLTVEKTWGTTIAATKLPSVTVQLYASTVKKDAQDGNTASSLIVANKTLTLSREKSWKGTFTNLPLYDDQGNPLYYYAVETAIQNVPLASATDGCYLVEIDGTQHHFRFHYQWSESGNTYKTTLVNVGYRDISGTKSWKDNSNAYDTRPDSIELTLLRKGAGQEVTITDPAPTWTTNGDSWTFTYAHLPETDDQGNPYTYEVTEKPIPPQGGDRYETTQTGLNLTNTLTGTVDLVVEKTWQDNENAAGLRPDEIQVQLVKNGVPDPSHTLTLSADNGWQGRFDDLAKYDANGVLIQYSIEETDLPVGYQVIVDEPVSGTPGADDELSFRLTNVSEGSVILSKTVTGNLGDRSKAFTFTFTLDTGMPSTSPSDAYPYTITRQDGTTETGVIRSGESVTLRHNESIHIQELPGHAAYRFTESDNDGYRVTQTGTSGMILPGDTVYASFVNDKSGDGGGGHPDPGPGSDPDSDPDPVPVPRPDPDSHSEELPSQLEDELPRTGQDWRTATLLGIGVVLLLGLGLLGRKRPRSEGQPLWRKLCIALSLVLLLAAAGLVARNLWEQQQAEESSAHLLELAQRRLEGETPLPDDDPFEPDPLAGYAIDGILSIPKLGLELPVLADYSDANLRLSICLYEQDGDGSRKVIAGHNYRSHFGQLGSLAEGDLLTYTDEEGNVTEYAVLSLTEIDAHDREALDAGEWDMTLFTCNADMSRRILVRLEETTPSHS